MFVLRKTPTISYRVDSSSLLDGRHILNETLFDRALTDLRTLGEASLDLICCSAPPFDLPQLDGSKRQLDTLIALFTPIVRACAQALKPSGSLILELERGWLTGSPVRCLFPYELILHLVRPVKAGGEGWHLAQELYLFDAGHCTTLDTWLAREGCRVRDPIRTAWWLSRTPYPKADNRRVLKPYSQAQRALMQRGMHLTIVRLHTGSVGNLGGITAGPSPRT